MVYCYKFGTQSSVIIARKVLSLPTPAVIAGYDPQSHHHKDDSHSNKTNTLSTPSLCQRQQSTIIANTIKSIPQKTSLTLSSSPAFRLHLMRLRVKPAMTARVGMELWFF